MQAIEKRPIIDKRLLDTEDYFTSLLQKAYSLGLLDDSQMERIQLQCIELLAYKCERYNEGESSSIRVEAAQSIMKSNFYTIGIYLKTLCDVDEAVYALKNESISEMYHKGKKWISVKLRAAKSSYKLILRNKIITPNYTYNATLDGISSFFSEYQPEYSAHEAAGSIDYQLCLPVIGLTGVEYIQKYIECLFLENEFCNFFDTKVIHHLLFGYDEGYKDLLINIFEQVLTGAVGCMLSGSNIRDLDISKEDLQFLKNLLSAVEDSQIDIILRSAGHKVMDELKITNPSLMEYIEKSLHTIAPVIGNAVRTDTLEKTFVALVDPESKPKIRFTSRIKMDDESYRRVINELCQCRYFSDKLALIKEKVKSFEDLEELLFDAQLKSEEIISVLGNLEAVEVALLIKRHPFHSDIRAVDLSESELALQACLKTFIYKLPTARREELFGMVKQLEEE